MEYINQVAPNAPTIKFSDRPLKVKNYGTITPKWAWSASYRNYVRQQTRNLNKQLGGDAHRYHAYNEWLRNQQR